MKNILGNLQFSHLKHFIKPGRNLFSFTSIKCYPNYLHGCKSLNEGEFKRGNSLGFNNIRYFNTSVKKFEKLAKVTTNVTKNNNHIIYSGSLTHRVKGVKVFTCMTSICGIIIQPWMFQKVMHGSHVPFGVALLSCVGFFTFVTPFLCHLFTKKYVTEIWYDATTDTYTATVLSFFLRRININFKVEDVTVPSVPPLFSTMYIKGKPVFIILDSFLEVEHYIKLMGYDKPMDLKLDSVADALNKPKPQEKSDRWEPFVFPLKLTVVSNGSLNFTAEHCSNLHKNLLGPLTLLGSVIVPKVWSLCAL